MVLHFLIYCDRFVFLARETTDHFFFLLGIFFLLVRGNGREWGIILMLVFQ